MSKFRLITKRMIAMWANAMKLDPALASKATAKGHKHIVGNHFKSIQHFDITPAEYRRGHFRLVKGKLLKPKKGKKKS